MVKRHPVGMCCFAAVAGLLLAAPALAQSSAQSPSPGNVGQQFSSGADSVGQGASQIGEGIRNGAIMTWQALRDGADAFASRFNGTQSPAP